MISGPLFKYLSGGLALIVLVLFVALKFEQRQSRKLATRNTELVELRKSDRASYEAAQAQAKAKNDATLQRVKAEQERINENTVSDFRRDLDRLRAQPRANQGAAGGAKPPANGETAGGADADGMPNAPCDDLCASEIELRLMHLQNWVERQSGVDPNR